MDKITTPTKVCAHCGRTFAFNRKSHSRWAALRFCSRQCSGASRKLPDPPSRNCLGCGVLLVRKPNEQNHSWRNRTVCSFAHINLRLSPPDPDQAGRARARRMYAWQPCEVCGGTPEGRHHRNSDRMDNSPENIAFLCRQHHKDAHQLTDQKVGGGLRPAAVRRNGQFAKADE